MRVIIAISSNFKNRELLYEKCDYYLSNEDHNVIIFKDDHESRPLVKKYVEDRGFSMMVAGTQRPDRDLTDEYMDWIRRAEGVIAFWDMKDNDIYNIITIAKEFKIKVRVVKY